MNRCNAVAIIYVALLCFSYRAPGAFVRAVVLPLNGVRSQGKVFTACVKSLLSGGRLLVSFLRKHPGTKFYSYPHIEDVSVITEAEVEEVMSQPQLDRRGRICF